MSMNVTMAVPQSLSSGGTKLLQFSIFALVMAMVLLLIVDLSAEQGNGAPAPGTPGAAALSDLTDSAPDTGTGGPATMGFGTHIYWQPAEDRASYVQLAADAGARTLRDGIAWSGAEAVRGAHDWAATDEMMRLTASRGINLLLVITGSPQWASTCPASPYFERCAPADDADYARFITAVANRYGDGGTFWAANPSVEYTALAGIEIWNEPNVAQFWWSPDGTRYASLLTAAYRAVEASDPTLTVVTGGMAPAATIPEASINPVDFLRQMYAAGAGGSFDAVGHHPYVSRSGVPAASVLAVDPGSAWSQMDATTPSLRSVMADNGDSDKQIWATEVGAPTTGAGVTEDEQAALAAVQVADWQSKSWAGNFYWYDLRDDCSDVTDRECGFGVVRQDNSLKPAYEALRDAFVDD